MKSRIKVDRISVLPKNVIDSILTRLPIMEAVRTSILSQSWRYQWHSLSKISIKIDDPLPLSACVKIIDHVLLVHCGSVDKFELDVFFETCNDIDRWMLYVSRNGIKELIINKISGEHYNLPSCLFSCSDLTCLGLTCCIFKPPPAGFKAFSNLSELLFWEVEITENELQNLLNSCPLLSRLSLLSIDDCSSLKINAPNLVMFRMREVYCYFRFENTPLLASASFRLINFPVDSDIIDNKVCKIVELLGSMPILQTLKFHDFALQHLAVGDVPPRLPSICPIKQLIVSINFEDLQELVAVFCIFRSSPFIQYLKLRVISGDSRMSSSDGFWRGEHDFSFRFDHLQTVKVTWFTGSKLELKFIEFLLSNAPALKTMTIDFDCDAEDELTTVKKLIRFPRISPKAELILPIY